MPKILFYDFNYPELQKDTRFPVGGATVQLHSWIKGFINQGWNVSVLVSEDSNYSLDNRVKFVKTYDINRGIPQLRWIYYRFPKLIYSIYKNKPDYLYHGVPGSISIVLYFIARILNIKFILRISNDFLVDKRVYSKYSRMLIFGLKFVYRFSDFLICQNNYQLQCMESFRKRKSYILANPFFYYNKLDNNDFRKYIAWIGIFQYQKNLPLLLQIIQNMPNFTFKIAGKASGVCDSETKHALDNLRELPNVQFVGYLNRQEIIDFLSKAKLLLNTSHYEGFSNTFLEAFYLGTPVVCPSNVDPNGVIKKYLLGEQFNSVDEVAMKIETVCSSFEDYSNNTLKYLTEFHDTNKLTQQFIRILMK